MRAASAKCDAPEGLTPGSRLGFQIDFEVVVGLIVRARARDVVGS